MLSWQARQPPARGVVRGRPGGPPPAAAAPPPAGALRRSRRRRSAAGAGRSAAGRGAPALLRRLPVVRRAAAALPHPARGGRRDHRGNDFRSLPDQRAGRSAGGSNPAVSPARGPFMVSRFARLGHVALVVCLAAAWRARRHARDTPGRPHGPARCRSPSSIRAAPSSPAPPSPSTGVEAANKAQTPAPVQTTPQGVATLAGLPPGRYTVHAEFPGFETRTLPDVRVRAGDNKQVMMLPIAGVTGDGDGRARQAGGGRRSARSVVRHRRSRASSSKRCPTIPTCCASSCRTWPAPAR